MNELYLFLVLLCIPLCLFFVIKSSYEKYKENLVVCKLSGFEVARKFLDQHHLQNMYIVEIKTGDLTDHYDAKQKVVRLSSAVYHGESIYSTAIALYQVHLAVLDKNGDSMFKMKAVLDVLFDFVYILVGIIFLMWIFLLDRTMLLVSVGLLTIALFYEALMLSVGFHTVRSAMEDVSDEKDFSVEEISLLKKVMQFTVFVPITRVSLLMNKGIQNLFSSLKNK